MKDDLSAVKLEIIDQKRCLRKRRLGQGEEFDLTNLEYEKEVLIDEIEWGYVQIKKARQAISPPIPKRQIKKRQSVGLILDIDQYE